MQKTADKMLVQLILVFYVLKKNIAATFQACLESFVHSMGPSKCEPSRLSFNIDYQYDD
jgi:hypothetical protein